MTNKNESPGLLQGMARHYYARDTWQERKLERLGREAREVARYTDGFRDALTQERCKSIIWSISDAVVSQPMGGWSSKQTIILHAPSEPLPEGMRLVYQCRGEHLVRYGYERKSSV